MPNQNHLPYMQIALSEAHKAEKTDEVPVGAVLVDANGEILAQTHNQTITLNDPTAHAEILALRTAADRIGNYRLTGTTLYVTIEPCIMCMGALVNARVKKLVYGPQDPKWGAAGSLYNFAEDQRLNHRIKTIQGILEQESRTLIQNFFRKRRKTIAK